MKDLIRQILKEETEIPIYFRRRVDSHKFEKIMRKNIMDSYIVSNDYNQFKNDLLYSSLADYMNQYHGENINDIDREQLLKYMNHLESVFGSLIQMYYKNVKKNFKG